MMNRDVSASRLPPSARTDADGGGKLPPAADMPLDDRLPGAPAVFRPQSTAGGVSRNMFKYSNTSIQQVEEPPAGQENWQTFAVHGTGLECRPVESGGFEGC
jgi:hypothetical protein